MADPVFIPRPTTPEGFSQVLRELHVYLPLVPSSEQVGDLLDASGRHVLTIDIHRQRSDENVHRIAACLCTAINAAGAPREDLTALRDRVERTRREALLARADELDRRLQALPAFEWSNRSAYDHALAELVALLEALPVSPAIIARSGDLTAVTMYRLRATSSMGVIGALRNWVRQARAKGGA